MHAERASVPEARRGPLGGFPRRALSVLAAAPFLFVACGESESEDPFLLAPDTPVVVIVIDTLRADHLSCYGYPLETSPVLDELASRSYLFEANSTQCNTTFPSLTSIFTGVYPKTHRNYLAVPIEGTAASSGVLRCAAEDFGDLGYYTAAATSHPSWGAKRDPDATLWKGWDAISHLGEPIPIEDRPLFARAENTNERLFGLLDDYDQSHSDSPLFLWAHYFDPHTDLYGNLYDPPAEFANLYLDHHFEEMGLGSFTDSLRPLDPIARNDWILKKSPKGKRFPLKLAAGRAAYDAEITSCDRRLQDLFDRLEASGVLDEAILVVMSDHGENMEEHLDDREAHAFTHNRLYEAVVHTPLLIHLPGQTEGRRISAITQNIDVLPMLMELLDRAPNELIEGKSLVPLLRGSAESLHEAVFMESSLGREKAARSGNYKLIDGWKPDEQELYEWRADTEELHNLLEGESQHLEDDLASHLESFRPEVKLRIHCEPMKRPYDLELQIKMPGTRIEKLEGVPKTALSKDRETFNWSGTIGPKGRDIVLYPKIYRGSQEVHWKIRHSGRDDLHQAVRLGKTPVSRTPAIPIWAPSKNPAPEQPAYVISDDSQTGVCRVEVAHEGARHVEFEVRYTAPRIDRHLEVLESIGFEERFPPDLRFHRSDAYGVDRAVLEIKATHPQTPRHILLRIDGAWPASEQLVINGAGVDTRSLHFMFPAVPKDKRIPPYLGAGSASDTTLPPGTVVIWQESGVDGGEIDGGHLSKEMADQLNSIGYLGDSEPEDDE